MPHILVVEDEQHLAFGIQVNLESEGHAVTTAADGQAALAAFEPGCPAIDLVVLDIMLPGMSGYDVCAAIRQRQAAPPIVMLSARTLVEDRVRGFDAGTDVYLQKPFELEELLSVVRNLLGRHRRSERPAAEPPRRTTVQRFGSCEVNFDTWEANARGRPVRLTNLEMKLLRYLVEHDGLVVSREELLRNVWGMTRALATRTIDTFMLNLRKAFEEDPSKPAHFLSVRGRGYRFVSDPATPPQPGPGRPA